LSHLTHRLAIIPDLYYVAPRLRKEDLAEVQGRGNDPLDSLIRGYLHGDRCWTLLADGVPAAIYGISKTSDTPRSGALWLLGTDDIYKHRSEFVRISRSRVAEISAPYDFVWNFVDSRNDLHIRWLRWLGFTFIRSTTEVSVDGTLFYEFVKITHV
jgi:hypothetical protein